MATSLFSAAWKRSTDHSMAILRAPMPRKPPNSTTAASTAPFGSKRSDNSADIAFVAGAHLDPQDTSYILELSRRVGPDGPERLCETDLGKNASCNRLPGGSDNKRTTQHESEAGGKKSIHDHHRCSLDNPLYLFLFQPSLADAMSAGDQDVTGR